MASETLPSLAPALPSCSDLISAPHVLTLPWLAGLFEFPSLPGKLQSQSVFCLEHSSRDSQATLSHFFQFPGSVPLSEKPSWSCFLYMALQAVSFLPNCVFMYIYQHVAKGTLGFCLFFMRGENLFTLYFQCFRTAPAQRKAHRFFESVNIWPLSWVGSGDLTLLPRKVLE